MFAMPRNHCCVSGTVATGGIAITSPASASRISHCAPAQASPSRDDSTCAAVLLARRVASSCWNERRSSLAARAMGRYAWVDDQPSATIFASSSSLLIGFTT